jgi:hypothetical protein
MLLTDAQLHEIRQIIADHHAAFVANIISPRAVAPDTLERLRSKGLLNVKINSVEDAYLYGQLLAALEDPKLARMSYAQFKEHLKRNPIPLSPIEQRAVQIAEHSAGQYAQGLGNRVDLHTGQTLINADNNLQAKMRDTIRTSTAESLAKRETAKQLASNLGWSTRDWARDWDRIAITEMHQAKERGTADLYAKRYGSGVLVAKRVMPDACEHCVRLHVGPDGHPRVFRLSELERNGTNHGRKARDWKPVVGTIHPWCQCTMVRIPAGWGFDEHDNLVPGGAGGVRYASHDDMELALREELDLAKSVALGHVDFQGLPVAIENAPGTVRHWKAPDGETGETRMLFAYGYVEGTMGADGDGIDVYVGPDPRAEMVYIIHQQNPDTGIYDEDKVMVGFPHEQAARWAYQAHFNRPDFAVAVSPMSVDAFKRWVAGTSDGNPLQEGKPVTRFVIPLEKSNVPAPGLSSTGNVAPEMVETRADARAPGPGVGANYLFNTPKRTRTPTLRESGFDPSPRELFDNLANRHLAGKKDRADYEFQQPLPEGTLAHPMELPDDWPATISPGDIPDIEDRKKRLIAEGLRNTAPAKNRAEIPESSDIDPKVESR